jgi:hypothetical protein
MFTNVFVPPAGYDYFLQHGRWPDKTMFVLEMYGSQSKGSSISMVISKPSSWDWMWK